MVTARDILFHLAESVWSADVWVDSNFVHGSIDQADRKRIVEKILLVIEEEFSEP